MMDLGDPGWSHHVLQGQFNIGCPIAAAVQDGKGAGESESVTGR